MNPVSAVTAARPLQRTPNHLRLGLVARHVLMLGLCVLGGMTPGCGSGGDSARETGHVSGTITLGGSPLGNAVITFEDPVRGIGASAPVNAGVYQFDTPLIVGDYTVAVQTSSPPPSSIGPSRGTSTSQAIPKHYQTPASSGLNATVSQGANTLDFELLQ